MPPLSDEDEEEEWISDDDDPPEPLSSSPGEDGVVSGMGASVMGYVASLRLIAHGLQVIFTTHVTFVT